MSSKAFGPLAASSGGLAVALFAMTLAMDLPGPAELVLIGVALLTVGSAGAFLGAALGPWRRS